VIQHNLDRKGAITEKELSMDPMDTNEHTEFSNIVGVFRDRSQAEQALQALQEAHLSDEQPVLTIYQPAEEQEEESPLQPHEEGEEGSLPLKTSNTRYLVHIRAEGKEQEAVGILVRFGANNSDLPHGTELVNGSIVGSGKEAAAPATPAPEATPDDLFGQGEDTGKPVPRVG
jgi:hypothetical protein